MHSANSTVSLWDEEHEDTKYRIRHIKGVSVRNLTPFPKRDTVASTLSSHQTTVAAQRGIEGAYIADDADLVMAKRRTRKVSSTSVATLRGIHQTPEAGLTDPGDDNSPNTTRIRRTSKARPPLSYPSNNLGPSVAGVHRPRSGSQASTRSSALIPPPSPISPTDSLFPSHAQGHYQAGSSKSSQRSLENVVSTRLVETLVTLSLTTTPAAAAPVPHPAFDTRSPPTHTRHGSLGHTRGSSVASRSSVPEEPLLSTSKASRTSSVARTRSITTASSSRASRTTSSNASLSPPMSHVTSTYDSTPSSSRPTSPPPSSRTFYVSQRCRPSTNPSWTSLDPENEFCLDERAQSTRASVTLWAGLEGQARRDAWVQGLVDIGGKGKGKERESIITNDQDPSWFSVHTWHIDLARAERLPRELEEHPEHLPPNTLLVSLGPSSEWHWFPPTVESHASGHISDGDELKEGINGLTRLSPRHNTLRPGRREPRAKTSAGLQDLVRLVSLESALADTIYSKEAILHNIDRSLAEDSITLMRRETRERELYLDTLRDDHERVSATCQQARAAISRWQDELSSRRRLLSEARGLLATSQEDNTRLRTRVIENQGRQQTLSIQQATAQTTLIRTIDFIYPIEPLVSGDLLFSILDVPLALPNGPSDPAPPLTLPAQPTINENSVASALGYAAHVVSLVSTYLGRLLPYPITYAASRSLVRDPISTMQGPRVFPLFPTGVETYRFEYAVFLLNKDIEILMTERNLRATDMRHTLPNVKNLLLTLTNGSSEEPKLRKRELSVVQASLNIERSTTPTSPAGLVGETAIASGTPTITNGFDEVAVTSVAVPGTGSDLTPRRQFLSPLATMLRLKYANTIRQEVAKEEARTTSLGTPNGASTASMIGESPVSSVEVIDVTEASGPAKGAQIPAESLPNGTISESIEAVGMSGISDDDTKTERGVKLDEIETPKSNGVTSHNTIRTAILTPTANTSDGYGGVLSFFRRGSGRKDAEKAVTAVETVTVHMAPEGSLPPLHNAIS
ncbi:hypothetical protein FRB94_009627 [Tulasnella sp. JGI-2019a]|nr:hypothetical protein FRB94_009627 [Tulasnella sp. JGI-2019a]